MASYVPRAVSALLQGGYWAGLSADTIYAYSHIAAAIWLAASGVLAMVVVLVLGKRLLPVGVTAARPRPMWCVAWVVGRVMGVLLFLYYLLAVTTVRTHTPPPSLVLCNKSCFPLLWRPTCCILRPPSPVVCPFPVTLLGLARPSGVPTVGV